MRVCFQYADAVSYTHLDVYKRQTKAPVMYRVDGTGAVNIKVEGQNAEVYTRKAEIGKAPQKIRVETRYEWTAERQDINDKYPGFADWVADPTANWYRCV